MSQTPDKSPEGPYKPIKQKLSLTRWSIKGPTHSDEWFLSEEAAQRRCYELNAAFAAGQAAQLSPKVEGEQAKVVEEARNFLSMAESFAQLHVGQAGYGTMIRGIGRFKDVLIFNHRTR